MKAVVIREPGGLINTRIEDIDEPENGIIVRVAYAGLNPVDINTIRGKTNYKLNPYPHIPGAEFVGTISDPGNSEKFKKGDRVIIFPRIFDGTCDRCLEGREELCRNGGIIGVTSNGGFAEYFSTDEEHLIRIPDGMSFEDAVSLPVGGLTSYHALKLANLKSNERILVVGASGNTGIYGIMIAKYMGARVYYISRKEWLNDLGAEPWKGEIVDVILNSLGSEFWDKYLGYMDSGGRLVTFGTFTGVEGKLNIAYLYTGERSIIGSTGGTRKEMMELLNIVMKNKMKSKIWKIYKLEEYEKAIEEYGKKDGRILLRL